LGTCKYAVESDKIHRLNSRLTGRGTHETNMQAGFIKVLASEDQDHTGRRIRANLLRSIADGTAWIEDVLIASFKRLDIGHRPQSDDARTRRQFQPHEAAVGSHREHRVAAEGKAEILVQRQAAHRPSCSAVDFE
jgi:hypothetical protein